MVSEVGNLSYFLTLYSRIMKKKFCFWCVTFTDAWDMIALEKILAIKKLGFWNAWKQLSLISRSPESLSEGEYNPPVIYVVFYSRNNSGSCISNQGQIFIWVIYCYVEWEYCELKQIVEFDFVYLKVLASSFDFK